MFGFFRKIRAKATLFLIELLERMAGQGRITDQRKTRDQKIRITREHEFKPVNQNACRADLSGYFISLVRVDIPTWHFERRFITNVLDIILTLSIEVLKAGMQSNPLFMWLMLAVAAGDVSKNTIKYIHYKISPGHAEKNQWFADAVGITVVSIINLRFLRIDLSRYVMDEVVYHILVIGSENLLQFIDFDPIVTKKAAVFTSKYLMQAVAIYHEQYSISRQETLSPNILQPSNNATQIPPCFEFFQENSSFQEGNITQWVAISLLSTSSTCQAYFNSSAIENFIKAQEHMCFYIKAFPGYGDQMAIINDYYHLREMGFEGMATFIYDNNEPSYDNKARIFRLFNLPAIEGNYSYYAAQKLEIIAETQAKNFTGMRQGSLLFNCFTGWHSIINVLISPHTGNYEKYMGINKVFMRDDINNNFIFKSCGANNYHLVRQIGTDVLPLVAPVSTLEMAEDYFQTVAGQALIKRTPALVDFVALLKSNTANIMTVYGKTFSKISFYNNLFNFILGADFAQKKLPQPFVIAVMFPIEDKYLTHFDSIINGKAESVISLLKHQAKLVPQQLRSAIEASQLRGNFSALKISDGNATKQLSNLRPGTVTVVTFDALDNVVFNAIYTGAVASDRNRPNRVLAAVGQGASAFTTSSNAGVPRIPCNSHDDDDEISSDDLSKASPELRHRLLSLSKRACNLPLPEFWESYDHSAYKMIGEFLVDAQNPVSEVSKFFQQARQQIVRGDRLRHAIFFVKQLLSMQQRAPDHHEQCLHIEVEKFSKGQAALAIRHSSVFNTTKDSGVVKFNPASNESATPHQRIG